MELEPYCNRWWNKLSIERKHKIMLNNYGENK